MTINTETSTNNRVIELDIEGMTCASCVARIERKLGRLDGVKASVNLPLESAAVTVPAEITDQQIIDTVNATGYTARLKTHGHTVVPLPDTPTVANDHGLLRRGVARRVV